MADLQVDGPQGVAAVIMESHVAGVSTRSVDDLVAALGGDSGISKSEVSRIRAGLDDTVEAFRLPVKRSAFGFANYRIRAPPSAGKPNRALLDTRTPT